MASSIPTGTGFHLAGSGGGGGSTDALTVYASGTAGEAIAVGDVLRFDRSGGANAGRLLKAQALSATSGVAADVVGVAKTAAAGAGSAVEYFLAGSVAGAVDAAPAATANGSRLYLSAATPGVGTLTAPSGAGEAVVLVGFLVGADGASTTPALVLRPSIIALL
jgi:hypothetical protein